MHFTCTTDIPNRVNANNMSTQKEMKMNRAVLLLPKRTVMAFSCIVITFFVNPFCVFAQDVHPSQLEFRRQAVRRMIFDRSQDIPLAGLWPAKVVGLNVMHPPVGEQVNDPRVEVKDGRLRISAPKAAVATRWVGGFNPFAVYDVAVHKFNGSGQVGMMFRDAHAHNRITATLMVDNGTYRAIRWVVVKDGQEVDRQDFAIPEALISKAPIRVRVQMLAVGVNLFIERNEVSTLIGRIDFVQHFDLRRKALMRQFEFCLHSSIAAGQSIYIEEATAALSPGIGQNYQWAAFAGLIAGATVPIALHRPGVTAATLANSSAVSSSPMTR